MRRINPVLLITLAVPGIAIVASFATLGAALRQPDHTLPEQYHWEGFRLDRDFERSAHAAALGVQAELDNVGRAGACGIHLQINGASPASVRLRITHGTQPALDRELHLRRTDSGVYAGECEAMPHGHWRLELTNDAGGWSIRQNVRGALHGARLEAAPRPAS